jgi:hypothetical protein
MADRSLLVFGTDSRSSIDIDKKELLIWRWEVPNIQFNIWFRFIFNTKTVIKDKPGIVKVKVEDAIKSIDDVLVDASFMFDQLKLHYSEIFEGVENIEDITDSIKEDMEGESKLFELLYILSKLKNTDKEYVVFDYREIIGISAYPLASLGILLNENNGDLYDEQLENEVKESLFGKKIKISTHGEPINDYYSLAIDSYFKGDFNSFYFFSKAYIIKITDEIIRVKMNSELREFTESVIGKKGLSSMQKLNVMYYFYSSELPDKKFLEGITNTRDMITHLNSKSTFEVGKLIMDFKTINLLYKFKRDFLEV